MNWWAAKTGAAPAPAAPVAPGQWWTTPKVAPREQTLQPPAVAPVTPQQQIPNGYGSGTEEVPIGALLSDPNYVPGQKVKSAKQTELCPNCGSGNYLKASPNTMAKCADCGHNERFEQMATGMGSGAGIKVTGPVRAARVQGAVGSTAPMGTVFAKV